MVLMRNQHDEDVAEYRKDDNDDDERGGATDKEGRPSSRRRRDHEHAVVQFKGRQLNVV